LFENDGLDLIERNQLGRAHCAWPTLTLQHGLLLDKLPEVLSPEQKRAKVHNLLTSLARKFHAICNTGSRKKPGWMLTADLPKKQ
jgi:hypothetical protein